jgi:hypothetical protein
VNRNQQRVDRLTREAFEHVQLAIQARENLPSYFHPFKRRAALREWNMHLAAADGLTKRAAHIKANPDTGR